MGPKSLLVSYKLYHSFHVVLFCFVFVCFFTVQWWLLHIWERKYYCLDRQSCGDQNIFTREGEATNASHSFSQHWWICVGELMEHKNKDTHDVKSIFILFVLFSIWIKKKNFFRILTWLPNQRKAEMQSGKLKEKNYWIKTNTWLTVHLTPVNVNNWPLV